MDKEEESNQFDFQEFIKKTTAMEVGVIIGGFPQSSIIWRDYHSPHVRPAQSDKKNFKHFQTWSKWVLRSQETKQRKTKGAKFRFMRGGCDRICHDEKAT